MLENREWITMKYSTGLLVTFWLALGLTPLFASAEQSDTWPSSFYTGERITLNFQAIDVRAALAIIADVTGFNLVASDGVAGQVTLNLNEVPWDQALALVLDSQGLASRQEGNVLVVAPAEELAQLARQALEVRTQTETLAPLVMQYVQVRYARAEELAQLLRGEEGFGLLTERGRVAVDQRTNMLLIQDIEHQIQAILETLERLDVAVRQVQIEARIVIASDSASRELGVNWGLSSNRGVNVDGAPRSGFNLGGAASGGDPGQVWFDPVAGERVWRSRGGLAVDLGGDGRESLTSFAFGYLAGDILLDLELRALESEGRSYTISQPRVITANQRPAVIKQGQERAYREAAASGAASVDFKEAVLSLEVTPQITPDRKST